MGVFNNFQNKDNVLFRNIIIGSLHAFKDRVYWYNVINNDKTKVDVPTYFTIAGSERFLSDIFLNSDELQENGKATGLYLKYPRATLSLENIAIQEEYLTNKFNRANFIRQDENNEVKEYSAEFIEMPFKFDMNVTICVDSIVDIFKCMESIFSNLYKNRYFYVDVFSVKVPCYFAIPPDLNKERMVNFGVDDKKELKVNFNIEVQVNYPIFKEETEIFAGTRMNDIIQNLYIVKGKDDTNFIGREITVEKDVWGSGNNTSPFYPQD